MNNNTTAPTYTLRGLQLIGWRDMQHALDYLLLTGSLSRERWLPLMLKKC